MVRQAPAPRTGQSPCFSLHTETRPARPRVPQASCSGGRRARTGAGGGSAPGGRAQSASRPSRGLKARRPPGRRCTPGTRPRPGPVHALPAPPGPPSREARLGHPRGPAPSPCCPQLLGSRRPRPAGTERPAGAEDAPRLLPDQPARVSAPRARSRGEAAGRRLFFFFLLATYLTKCMFF